MGKKKRTPKYERHRDFIEYKSRKQGISWTYRQANFSVGVWGSIRISDFDDRLQNLGVESERDRKNIRTNAIYKTLDLSDSLLKLFHIAIQKSPQWMYEVADTEFSNSYKQRYHILQRFTVPLADLEAWKYHSPQTQSPPFKDSTH